MSDAYQQIQAGLLDAIHHAKGEDSRVIVHHSEKMNVKAIREKTGLSRQKFCVTLGISMNTLQHWEQGVANPRGTAKVLLKIVEQNPNIMNAIDS